MVNENLLADRGTETPLSACSRPFKAVLLHSLHACVHGFNYMLNEDERLLLAKQHVLSVLFIIRVLGEFLSVSIIFELQSVDVRLAQPPLPSVLTVTIGYLQYV